MTAPHPMTSPIDGDYECVALTGLILPLHIGIRDWERASGPQAAGAGRCPSAIGPWAPRAGTRIADCLDYSRLYRYLTTDWQGRGHTDLLETLAHDLVAFVFEDATIKTVRVRLAKLDVYLDDAVPSFEIIRNR